MIDDTNTSPLLYARVVGLLYIVLLVAGPFSLLYVDGSLIVDGDATETANNIASSELLFRLGLAGHGITLLADLGVAVLLYAMFKPVNPVLSMAAMCARLGTVFIHAVAIFISIVVLLLVGETEYLPREQQNSLLLLFINLRQSSGLVWGMFFGVHCLLIGILTYKSGFLPKVIGLLMLAPGIGYLLNSFGTILAPDFSFIFAILVGVGTIGELAFAFWLLIKGLNVQKWYNHDLVKSLHNKSINSAPTAPDS